MANPRFLEDGTFQGYISSAIDITERKRAEEELFRFKFMADYASDPFILMRENGSFEYLNQAALDSWGYSAEEAKALKVPDIDPIYNQDFFATTFATAQKEELPLIETLHKKKDGSIYPVEVRMGGFSIDGRALVFAIARDITQRRAAEKKIKMSERNLRLMIHQAPVAIAILRGPTYIIEIANTHILELWGRGGLEVMNKPLLEAIPEIKDQIVSEELNQVYKTGVRFETKEMPVVLKRNGTLETVYINFSLEPLYNTQGNIDGIMPVGFDVTEQVKARQKVEVNKEKLDIVIDASGLGTWEYFLKSNKVKYSRRHLEIFGYLENDKPSHPDLVKHIHPDDFAARAKAHKEAIKTGILDYRSRILWKDNSLHWIEVKGKVFYNKEKKPIRMIGTVRDITNEKHAEKELLEREQKFRLLADSLPEHIWTSDTEGNLNYFNQSVFDYSGLTLDQITEDGWIQIVHPDDREENINQWMNSIKTGKDFLIEHRFRRFDGEFRWQLSRAIPQKDEHGNIRMWVGSSTDIQDQKMFLQELEKQVSERTAELARKNVDLEKMNKELQSFAYISSHDLQEPLRKIQTFSSRIMDKELESLSERGKDYLMRMQNAANRMQTLIEDLLAYSRTSTGEQKFKKMKLSDVVAEVAEDLKEELEQKDAQLEVNAPCEVDIIHFQFRQLLINLIGNSLKFVKNDINPVIKISSIRKKGADFNNERLAKDKYYCRVRVEDNGIGFEPKHAELIFELFQRLYGKSEYKGTGIGLAIVKKIVENHNGIVIASGQKNQGATFDIYLPTEQEKVTL